MNRKLSRTDIVVLIICSAILVMSAVLLYLEMTLSYGEGTGRPVGDVSYRNRIVQRRDPAQVVWQRLNPGDTVFDGDSVRTDETAEAVIDLKDGSKIELDPESLIVLHLREKMTVTLVKGSAIIRPGSQGVVVERSGRRFTTEAGPTRFFVDPLNDKDGEIETDGTASVLADDGTVILRPGESLQTKDGKDRRIRRGIAAISPEDNARFFYTGDSMEVEFRWQGAAGTTTVELYAGAVLEKNLQIYDVQNDSRLVLELKAANYFWRVRQGDEVGPLRRLRLRRKSSPQLLMPRPEAKIRIASDPGYVSFRWKEEESASSYFIELARDRSFTDRVAYQDVRRTGLSIQLSPGRYYWRVLARGSVPGADSESSISSFEVVAAAPSALAVDEKAPEKDGQLDTDAPASEKAPGPAAEPLTLLYPTGVVDMTGKNFLLFRWKGIPAERTLMLRDATGTVVFQTRVTGNSFTLTDLSVLDTGVFRWTLESAKDNAQAKFTIVLHENLAPPELEIR